MFNVHVANVYVHFNMRLPPSSREIRREIRLSERSDSNGADATQSLHEFQKSGSHPHLHLSRICIFLGASKISRLAEFLVRGNAGDLELTRAMLNFFPLPFYPIYKPIYKRPVYKREFYQIIAFRVLVVFVSVEIIRMRNCSLTASI